MAIVIRICVFLMVFGIAHTKEWKPEIFVKGENATIHIVELQMNGKQSLEINFAGFTSKRHVSNVMLYDPMKNESDQISVTKHYAGRITRFKMNNDGLSFLLLNVNFLDSGNYIVSTLEGSVEKGKTSILVPRQTILGQDGGLMIFPFMINKTNISSIKIETMIPGSNFLVVIYDVSEKNCTEFGELFKNQIESCVFNGITFSFTIRRVTWLEKVVYIALDDMNFLLDSVFADIHDIKTSSLETINGDVTLPSAVNGSPDSSKVAKENDVKSTHVQGDQEVFDEHETNGSLSLEIDFSGYNSMLHVTNVIQTNPNKNQHVSGSFSRNYTGQIQMIVINKDSLRFQLLSVRFVHKGDVRGSENSCENRNANIVVLRRRLVHQDGELGTRMLMCNDTNIYSIKTDIMQTNVTSPVVVYNVTHGNCSLVAQRYSARIQGCVFSGNNVSFTFREVSWLNGTMFAAYNDNAFLVDSILIDIQGSSQETRNDYQTSPTGAIFSHDSPNSNDKPILLHVSAVVVVGVAAFLAMIAFRKIRHRRVPSTATNDITCRNRRNAIVNSSRNLHKNVKEAVPAEETRMVSAKSNDAVNQTDNTSNKGLIKVRLKKENIYHRRFDNADSSTRRTRNFQTDSLAHLYDYIHENHDHCVSYESNLRSSPNSTESIAEPCCEYDYVVQHSFMTLRPPAPDPVVTKKTKDQGTRDCSISWYKRLNMKASSRVDPLALYAEINKERSGESNYTVSSSEPGNRDFINQLAPSSYFELEGIRATGTMNSPSWLKYGVGPNWRKAENLNSSNFVPRPEFSELREISKNRRVAQVLNYDYPRSYFDHPSALDRIHRRSQSLSDMMAIASVRWSRRSSARSYLKKDCYDSL